jgi:hypothetical protein
VGTETQRLLALLERRIALLGSLAEALSAASSSTVAFDIDGLEARISEQERLCNEIRSLDSQLDTMQRRCASQAVLSGISASMAPGATDSADLRNAAARLKHVQTRVKELNDAHQALLQRSRRTVFALLRSYHSFASGTYANPSAPQPMVGDLV